MVQFTIKDVPEEVRDVLEARAARNHQSLQEYLRCELERIASELTLDDLRNSNSNHPAIEALVERRRQATDEWLKTVREHKANMKSRITTEEILAARDADRK